MKKKFGLVRKLAVQLKNRNSRVYNINVVERYMKLPFIVYHSLAPDLHPSRLVRFLPFLYIGPVFYFVDTVVPRLLALVRDDATQGEAMAITGLTFASVWTFIWRSQQSKHFTPWFAVALGCCWYGYAHLLNMILYNKHYIPYITPWDPRFKFDEDSNVKKFFRRVDQRVEDFHEKADNAKWRDITYIPSGYFNESKMNAAMAENEPVYNPIKYSQYKLGKMLWEVPKMNELMTMLKQKEIASPINPNSKEQYDTLVEVLEAQKSLLD